MKKLKLILVFLFATCIGASAQIKNTSLGKSKVQGTQINKGIKIPNAKELSTAQISKLKLPSLTISEQLKNARPLTTWRISPAKLKDTYLGVSNFFGYGTRNLWELHSMPMVEGREVTRWSTGFLSLTFRQSQQVGYRMKIKLRGSNFRGKEIYVQVNDFSAKYPVDPNDGTVNVAWTANRTKANATIDIGQLMKPNNTQDQRQAFPVTKIEYVQIDKISQ